MSILKCKLCGETFEANENQTTVFCPYCGAKQTQGSLQTGEACETIAEAANAQEQPASFNDEAQTNPNQPANEEQLKQKAKHRKRWIVFGVSGGVLALCVLIVAIVLVWKVYIPGMNYGKGMALLNAGKDSEAYLAFKAAGNYGDTKEILKDFLFLPTKGTVTSISDGEKRTYEESFTYDERGNVIEKTFGDSIYEYIYEYDDDYHVLSKYEIRNGEVITEEHSEYDEWGGVIQYQYKSQSFVDPDTTYEYRYEYTREYDENGNAISTTSVRDGTDIVKTYFEYDAKGNLISSTQMEGDTEVGKTNYEYDQDGNVTKVYSDSVIMEYNENGDITLYQSNPGTSDEYKTTYSYEYDDTYGWINKQTSTQTSDGEEDIMITEYEDYTILYCSKDSG